jgi:hypothetical protein
LLAVQRHRHEGPKDQPVHRFASANQQLPQAAGEHRHQDVVDLGMVGVGDPPHKLQVAANQGVAAVAADPPVQAGLWRLPFQEGLVCCWPATPDLANRLGGMGQPGQRAANLAQVSAQVVAEQLTL